MIKLPTLTVFLFVLIITLLNCIKEEKKYSLKQDTKLEKSRDRGSEIYSDFCVSCHLPSGKGVKNAFPPLANSDYLKNKRTESIRGIKYGLRGEIVVNGFTYNGYMAPMGLGNDEIADVMNYINHSWGNSFGKIVTEEEVTKITK
jgi:mono/diheme cytochrome c family protein